MFPHLTSNGEDLPSGRLRILVAEDNPINQMVVAGLLRKAGHTVSLASDGVEAVSLVARHDFDTVIMDVQMPKMDGLQAAAHIRSGEQGTQRHLPIIAVTADATRDDRQRCRAAGMDGYLTKPIVAELLFEAIAAALAPPPGMAPPPRMEPGIPQAAESGRPPQPGADDLKFQQELAGMFLEDCHPSMSRIRAAIDHRDAAALKSAAHFLKGSVAVFQDAAAFDAAFRMECIGREADWNQAETAWTSLLAETDRLSRSLSMRRFP